MLVVGANLEKINNLNKQLLSEFEMKDLGATKQILGMRINRDEQGGTLQLSQAEYICKVL
jgi:ATP-binding cassette subfamily B (MDR/TAP) protein 1